MSEKMEITLADRTMSFEAGALARQADGAIVAQYGETVVLAAAVMSKTDTEGRSFFPLSVDYRERMYAGGKVPGGFFKREGRPRDKEILTSRLIDRTIRPLFPDALQREIQVDALVLCADGANDPDIVALNAAATALHISGIPFAGPVAAVRVGYSEGQFITNPTGEQRASSQLDLIVAGNRDRIVMMEGDAAQLKEDDFQKALEHALREIGSILDAQEKLRSLVGREKTQIQSAPLDPALEQAARQAAPARLKEALSNPDKLAREELTKKAQEELLKELSAERTEAEAQQLKKFLGELEWETVRDMIIDEGARPDGRGYEDIRPLSCSLGVLPRTHGSAIFGRGQTQALVAITLGTEDDAQKLEALDGTSFKHFLLHYNFPSYSVGEVRMSRGPGRREIGHGHLAERAFTHLLPSQEEFTYVVRAVSEILESNGSSSMATACGTSLALMDAGVPIKAGVAGISIGLVQRDGKRALLTDIQGIEDGMGDMDFKVAGTAEGITAVQLDVKTEGLPLEVFQEALERARAARLSILEVMNAAISQPRASLSPHAPRVELILIPPDKIGGIIGTGGKTIRKLIADSGCTKIEVLDDTGRILVVAANEEALNKGADMIRRMTEEAEVGRIYSGKVTKIVDFGAFVEILPGTEGLVHVSQLAHERVRHPADVLKEGEEIQVKVLEVDPGSGKIRLSRKEAMGGQRPSEQAPAPLPEPGPQENVAEFEEEESFPEDDEPQPPAGAHQGHHAGSSANAYGNRSSDPQQGGRPYGGYGGRSGFGGGRREFRGGGGGGRGGRGGRREGGGGGGHYGGYGSRGGRRDGGGFGGGRRDGGGFGGRHDGPRHDGGRGGRNDGGRPDGGRGRHGGRGGPSRRRY